MGTQRQVVRLLIEADLGGRSVAQTGAESTQHVAKLEAALLLMRQRDVVHVMLVQANHERRYPPTTRNLIQTDHLKAGAFGAGERVDQAFEIRRSAHDGDRFTRGG